MKRKYYIGWFFGAGLVVLSLAMLSGCGYSTQSTLDHRFQTVHVSPAYDDSQEIELQAPLTNALTRKFIQDGRLQVTEREDADLLVEMLIQDYELRGLITDARDEVTQFLMIVQASARVTDQQTGEVLWEEPALSGETSYHTRASGSSSDRLRGNTETFITPLRSFPTQEENRAAAEALDQLASDIFYRTVEPW